jgi:RimJ/RimL family protein N-acetyltransferase
MRYETDRLIVRPPRLDDAPALFRNYTQDAEVTKYLTWEPHERIEQTREWLEYCVSKEGDPDSLMLTLCEKESDEAIGMLEFRIDGFRAEFGYVLAKRFWGRGLMTEAMRPALAHVFDLPRVYRIWAVHDVDNPASGKVMQKLGLIFEGVLRRFTIHPNVSAEPRDVRLYSLVK